MTKTCIDINGPWEFREYPETARKMADLDEGRWLTTSHPESVFLSLAEAGILRMEDVYASPEAFGWVAKQAWIFRTVFDTGPEEVPTNHTELVLEGLDTLTRIWLNEKKIGGTDNAFIAHRLDVGTAIRPGRNTLLIKFCPPQEHAQQLISKYGSPNDPSVCNPDRVFVRKSQCQFGSAMGPALLDCGITGPVRLERIPAADLADIHVRTIDCNSHYADMRIAVSVRRCSAVGISLQCRLTIEGGDQPQTHLIDLGTNDTHAAVIRIPNPKLWWPRGYGSPHLYTLRADLVAADQTFDSRQQSFGIRMIRILRTKDTQSAGFGIEINQQPIYIKGIVWLPVSLYADKTDHAKTTRLIDALADTHINMIRIWGGGTYGDDHFYNLCDRIGILVWQDFMFASACYPDYEGFSEQVSREAQAVILRLRNHPCLTVWCGNSHIDSLCQSGKISRNKKSASKELFTQLLPDLLAELNPDCDYLPSAPEPHLPGKAPAVTDLWQSWNEYKPMESWMQEPLPPFVVETGFQSLPSQETLRIACPDEEQTLAGPGVEKLNYHTEGMQRLARFASDYFAPPGNLAEQIYQTQLVQARYARQIVETLRANNTINRGILLWSGNDFWPAAGFSMLDFQGRPKALYFYARRFWASVLICLGQTGPARNGYIVNDTPSPLTAQARFQLLDIKGGILDQSQSPVSVSPYSTASITLPRDLLNPVCPEKSILHMAVYQEDVLLSENTYLFTPDKYARLRPLDMDITVESIDRRSLHYTLQSRWFVKDLEIVLDPSAALSDNFFDMLPGRRYQVRAEFPECAPDIRHPLILRSSCRA
ncbi:MAG TPA: hypothetical protein PKB02_05995 [Anaerohalosphaeraceae bacterium]|nr:hypothetical protein [Anaerohalosphaeraceae bacterium]